LVLTLSFIFSSFLCSIDTTYQETQSRKCTYKKKNSLSCCCIQISYETSAKVQEISNLVTSWDILYLNLNTTVPWNTKLIQIQIFSPGGKITRLWKENIWITFA
jgi:hypothetical protein